MRKKKNLTQEDLAKIASIERTFISHIESGDRNVSIETLEKILKAVDSSFSEFFSSEDFKPE